MLAEQKRFPREKLCGEFISPECLTHFAELGVIERMQQAHGARLTDTVFYPINGRGVAVPSSWFGDTERAALGLSRAEMDLRLLERARSAGAEVQQETTITGLISEDGVVRGVRTRSADNAEREVSCGLVVDATGRVRAVARRTDINGAHPEAIRAPFVAFKAHLADARIDPLHCEIYVYRGGYGGVNAVENGLFNHCFIVRTDLVRGLDNDAERVMREVVMTNGRAQQTLSSATAVTPWLAVALPWYGRQKLVPAEGLITVGDSAAFIDPFTGSGMLMALEGAEVAAQAIAEQHREGYSFVDLANKYQIAYDLRFRGRLRVSRWLRRAAFAPGLAAMLVRGLGASSALRRRLARSTRGRREPCDAQP
jgi:flavin-dependent dehydrogenase